MKERNTTKLKNYPEVVDLVGQIGETVPFRVKDIHTIDDPAMTEKRKAYQQPHERSSSVLHHCAPL